MKRLLTFLALTFAAAASFGATLNPVQLLNPSGSTAGQAIVSTGASSAPAWGNVTATALAAQAANTVIGNATGSSASPTAITVTGCNGAAQALQWTNGSGFGCNSAIATSGANTNITSLNAPALGAATATTQGAASNSTLVATTAMVQSAFASPPAIGATAPNAGTFTTLKGNSLAKVFATNTSAQSIPAGANTPVTGWTTGFDANSNFNASTGTFTAPATGYYVVSAQLLWGTMAGAGASNVLKAVVFANGSATNLVGITGASSTTQQFNSVQVSGIVSLTAGQTIVLNAVQATGSSVALSTTGGGVWISICQIP